VRTRHRTVACEQEAAWSQSQMRAEGRTLPAPSGNNLAAAAYLLKHPSSTPKHPSIKQAQHQAQHAPHAQRAQHQEPQRGVAAVDPRPWTSAHLHVCLGDHRHGLQVCNAGPRQQTRALDLLCAELPQLRPPLRCHSALDGVPDYIHQALTHEAGLPERARRYPDTWHTAVPVTESNCSMYPDLGQNIQSRCDIARAGGSLVTLFDSGGSGEAEYDIIGGLSWLLRRNARSHPRRR
jgi:hypothetical protein